MNEFRGSIVIIGASAAGITAAKQIRKANAEAEVIVFTEEPHFPYFRPFLTEYLCETSVIQKDNFYLNPEKWYRDNRIDLRLAEKVTSIDPAAKTVSTAKGGSVAYEKLILANGSAPFVPKPELLQKENVFAIRTLDDAKHVEQFSNTVKRATVIGGGVLGIETADALIQKGLRVTVIEYVKRILPIQLDEEGSEIFQAIMQKSGVELKLGTLAQNFAGTNRVTAIGLQTGEEIPTDMVVFCIGVRANLELAKSCGLTTNRGVVVNEKMETNLPDIYACGDVAECGQNISLWTVAVEQGKTAGLNAIGEPAAFSPISFPTRIESFDTKVFSIGDLGHQCAAKEYVALRRRSPDEYMYKQLYFKGDAVTGGVLIGDVKKATALSKAMNRALSKEEMLILME